jgi:hypothetical protein
MGEGITGVESTEFGEFMAVRSFLVGAGPGVRAFVVVDEVDAM